MAPQSIHPSQKKIPVAWVNGVVISQYQVESGLQTVLDPYRDTKGKVRLSQEQQYAARKHVIDNLVTRELLYQEGCRKRITATEEEISEVMEHSAKEYQTEQQFKAMLLMMGLNPAEYHQQVQRDIIINKFAASLVEGKRRSVTTEEARKYYEEHPEEMTGPEVRKILHLFIPLDRYASKQEEQKARNRLERIRFSKKEFEKIIKSGNQTESEIKGEDLGFIARGQMHPLLDSIAFRMPEGEISRIIRTDEGLHLLLVKIILEEGEARPFSLIEEELKNKIYEIRSVSIVNQYTDKLKKKATIEILDRIADNKLEQEREGQ
jgi:parvulin-like peptidyl-prolyl isomerase